MRALGVLAAAQKRLRFRLAAALLRITHTFKTWRTSPARLLALAPLRLEVVLCKIDVVVF